MRLEKQKLSVLSGLASWSPAQLNFRPTAQSWSSLNVLDHLQKTEQGILDAVIEGLARPRRLEIKDRMGSFFLTALFLFPSRVRVPRSASAVLPGDAPNRAQIEDLWASTRTQLATVVADFPNNLMSLGIFQHPVSGWMNMSQVLGFYSAHLIHHEYQLNRLKKAFLEH